MTQSKLPLVALLIASLYSSPAFAVDWELLYSLSESVRASNNIQLVEDPDGVAGSSNSLFGLEFKTHTRTVDWTLGGNVGYLAYFGADDAIPDPSTVVTYSAKSDLLKRTKDTDYTFSAFFTRTPATTSELDTIGFPTQLEIDRFNYGANTSVAHRVNKRNRLIARTSFSQTEFSENVSGVTPNTFLEGSLDWINRVNRRVDANVKASVGWQHIDSYQPSSFLDPLADPLVLLLNPQAALVTPSRVPETDNLIYTITVGADARLTRRLSAKANAGVAIIDQYIGNTNELSVGFEGDLTLVYQPLRDLTTELSISQTVAPDNLGDLRETRKINSSTVYTINDHSSLLFDAAVTLSSGTSGGDSDRETLSITPQYIHRLVRHWNTALGYEYVVSGFGSESRDSHTVFVTVSHSGTLKP